MAGRKVESLNARILQQPLLPKPNPPIVRPDTVAPPPQPAADLGRAARLREQTRREAEACAKIASLPVRHEHAAGIDVGDSTHWVCVDYTPDGSDTVRELPAHTPGLRQLVDWLRHCGVTTVALEASGVYGHVLFLTLMEAGFQVVMTAPQFARQIKGRPFAVGSGQWAVGSRVFPLNFYVACGEVVQVFVHPIRALSVAQVSNLCRS